MRQQPDATRPVDREPARLYPEVPAWEFDPKKACRLCGRNVDSPHFRGCSNAVCPRSVLS